MVRSRSPAVCTRRAAARAGDDSGTGAIPGNGRLGAPARLAAGGTRLGRDGYSEADLALLATAVERVLMAEGLPAGTMTDFGTKKAQCDVHAQSVCAFLHMPGGLRVRVVHCGCDRFYAPVAPAPEGIDGMARDLAEDVLWYWHRRDEAVALLATVPSSRGIDPSVTTRRCWAFRLMTSAPTTAGSRCMRAWTCG